MPEFEMDDSDEEEEKKVRMMRDPGAPTQAQVDAHKMTHLPFRAWCSACVAGTAKDRPHRKDKAEEKGIATMVFDYGFLGTEGVKGKFAYANNEACTTWNDLCTCSSAKRTNGCIWCR